MKIEGPQSSRGAGSVRRAERKGSAEAFSRLLEAEEPQATARTQGAAATGRIDALLALQEVEDPVLSRRRAVRRGSRLLDRLDELRLALLDGAVAPATLQALAQMVSEERPNITDPGLLEVIDEIDLRVQVELAKFERDQPR